MKVQLVTPAGTKEVEIPPETKCIRVGFYRDSDSACVDVNIDAMFEVDVIQHLIGTWIEYGVPEFGSITPNDDEPA